ncbi:U3 Small Nucleolar Rna-Associated Protein 14-like A [Manis pentadactyla]|nr:U3 Small Nucleolar Rna-Associated Protein 14-like A [Manis pentadactyla]
MSAGLAEFRWGTRPGNFQNTERPPALEGIHAGDEENHQPDPPASTRRGVMCMMNRIHPSLASLLIHPFNRSQADRKNLPWVWKTHTQQTKHTEHDQKKA